MANNYLVKDANGNNVTFISYDTGGGVELAESCPHDGTNKMKTLYDLDTSGSTHEWSLGVGLRISASGGSVEAKGQKAMASSVPVVVASDQSAIPASQSGTWNVIVNTALPTGANTIGAVTQASGPWIINVTQFGGTNIVTGTGASGSGIPRVTVSNDSNVLATQSGTWTVAQGTAAALSSAWPVKVTDGTNTLPTGDAVARTIYTRLGAQTTDQMTEASINISASGDNLVVAAVGGQTVRVHRLFLVCNAAVNIQFYDGTSGGGTALTGVMNFLANGGLVLDFSGEPWFKTSTGNGFNINLSGAQQVSGRIYYTQS
jgi:hypothetical protein